MGFREGLFRARGQIAFLVALVCSTGVIIYLEMFDAEVRIRDRVLASIAVSGENALSPALKPSAEAAVAQASTDYARDPSSAANRAALLNATVLATAQGLGSRAERVRDAEQLLELLENEPPGEAWAVSPALTLLAAAIPDLQPRVSALLARE
jgi:hypothetical protein